MAYLDGPTVRYRAARRGWDLAELATRSGIWVRTLQNATRENRPDPIRLPRAYKIAAALAQDGEDVDDVGREILDRRKGDGVPDKPPRQPKSPNPPSRRDKEGEKKGPRRLHDLHDEAVTS